MHSTTGKSPFETMFGEKARWDNWIARKTNEEVPYAHEQAVDLVAMRIWLEAQVEKAVASQARFYNKKHKAMKYNAGDKVFFNSKNVKSTRLSKKLDYKKYGPYEIEAPVGKVAYRLKHPANMKIHNVFHVSFLEPYTPRGNQKLSPPPPIVVDEEEFYEVEEILDSRLHYGKLQYLVKWVGYPHAEDVWLGKDDVKGSSDLIEVFHRIYPDKPDAKSKPEQRKQKRGGKATPASKRQRKS